MMEDLAAARDRFLETGGVEPGVRPVVRDAWLRSREFEVDPGRLRPQSYDAARADRAGARSRALIEAAEPYLDLVHRTLEDEPHLAALADRDGVILRLVMDEETAETAEAANLFRGACWHEREIGCNGVGTALATGAPVVLLGPEHFQAEYGGWTCIGVPLRDPDGVVVGALDFSVPNEHISAHAWGWVLAMGRAIEGRVERGAVIDDRELEKRVGRLEDPLNAVRGVLDLLGSQLPLSPTHQEVLDHAREQVAAADEKVEAAVKAELTSRTALERESRAKDRLLAMLSHELRGPLSGLMSSLELVRLKQGDPSAVDRALTIAEQQIRHMVKLIDDVKDQGAVTRTDIQLQKARLDLRAVVDEAVTNCRVEVEKKRHFLTVQTPREPLWVDGDHTRLVQVAVNLLSNAAKFTDPGGQITLRADRVGEAVRLTVADNGRGIDPELEDQIFGLFVRGERTGAEGSGLGLNLVSRLVHLHGGDVSVESDGPGQGSVFTVRLPAA